MSDSNAAIVKNFISSIWNDNKIEKLDDYLTSDYIDKAYNPPNKDGLLSMVTLVQKAIPDGKWTIDRAVQQDNIVVCEMTFSGTHTGQFRDRSPKGNRVSIRAYRTFVIRDNKISEHSALLDTLKLFGQMDS